MMRLFAAFGLGFAAAVTAGIKTDRGSISYSSLDASERNLSGRYVELEFGRVQLRVCLADREERAA